mmetsp:Transcript_129156/g.237638  ORF Transcript_129156/g.237638 Transcript_129156/m.237638 type:complete len:112 (-) Transcript_129156:346-681(-)
MAQRAVELAADPAADLKSGPSVAAPSPCLLAAPQLAELPGLCRPRRWMTRLAQAEKAAERERCEQAGQLEDEAPHYGQAVQRGQVAQRELTRHFEQVAQSEHDAPPEQPQK